MQQSAEANAPSPSRPKRRWRRIALVFLIAAAVLATVRAFLPGFVRSYVNRTLDQNLLYAGTIGTVRMHLWRGAYSISDVRISKTSGNVPVPFFSVRHLDFAIQWNALVQGKIVGRILMDGPELNFVDGESGGESQTGAGGPWLEMLSDLFPFRINQAVIRNGSVHFRAFQTARPIDVYVTELNGQIDNLGNIHEETTPLVSTVRATGLVMDHAQLEFQMTLDPFSYRPTFQMATRLLGLDVTRLNDLARAYGKFDFERGWLDLIIQAKAREGQLTGYAKPLFRNLKVFSFSKDIHDENALQFFWQALVGAATSLLKNQPRDQFGTLVPFTGDLSETTRTDILATIGNILRNAFVRAYLPRLEPGNDPESPLQFSPGQVSDPISPAESS